MKKAFMAAAVVVMGLAATVPYLDAQDQQPPPQGDHRGPGGRGGRMGGPMGGGFAMREVMHDLTDAQREQIKAIHEKNAERIRPLAERARAAHDAVQNAIESGNIANLQALSIEVGNAETELTFAQAQVQAEVFKVLTPEQKQKIAERRKEMDTRRQEMMKKRQQP